jgi:hypothetical protein
VGKQISTTTSESSTEVPQKSKDRTANDPVTLPLGIYPKEHKSEYDGNTCTLMFIVALFTIAKLLKQLRCPTTDEWIKKLWYMCHSHKE